MNDNLSDVVNLEHAVAGVVGELLVLIVHGLLMCGSSYKVELASKGDAPRHDGSRLFIKIEELNDSLINLLLDPAEVILKPANKGTCRFQRVRHVVSPKVTALKLSRPPCHFTGSATVTTTASTSSSSQPIPSSMQGYELRLMKASSLKTLSGAPPSFDKQFRKSVRDGLAFRKCPR